MMMYRGYDLIDLTTEPVRESVVCTSCGRKWQGEVPVHCMYCEPSKNTKDQNDHVARKQGAP